MYFFTFSFFLGFEQSYLLWCTVGMTSHIYIFARIWASLLNLTYMYLLWCRDGTRNFNITNDLLSVLKKKFERHPISVSVEVGQTAVLQCLPPEGKPLPEVNIILPAYKELSLRSRTVVILDITTNSQCQYVENITVLESSDRSIKKICLYFKSLRPAFII